MDIKIGTEEDLIKKFREAVHILNNMRNIQKRWDEFYGVELKIKKKSWEKKADEFLENIGTPQINIKR